MPLRNLSEHSVHTGSDNYWCSLKRLNSVVSRIGTDQSDESIKELEQLLQCHKPDLMSLLANEPRNPTHREAVQKSAKDGITFIQDDKKNTQIIPEKVVNEAILLSDMFDLNELIALELLIMGSEHETRYPGMTRGPIAVLLYYDSKRVLLSTLKFLVDIISGRTWAFMSSQNDDNALKFIETFVGELKNGNIIQKCLENLEKFDVSSEYDKLLINKALGPGKYKKHVYTIIKDIKHLYAQIVFSFAAQSTLSQDELKHLLRIISEKCELDSNGCLDAIGTTLLMSLLYVMDTSLLRTYDENDPAISKTLVTKHKTLFDEIHKCLETAKFSVEGLQVIIKFALLIAYKTLSLFLTEGMTVLEGEEDKMYEDIIEKKLFETMTRLLAQNPHVYKERYYIVWLHNALSDFIALFPLKIKELRDKGDESGRIIAVHMAENIQPPRYLSRNLEKLLYLMAEVYSHDNFGFSSEIWNTSQEESRLLPKYIAFRKFIRSMVDSSLPQVLHVPILNLFASFANTSPFHVYNLLKHPGINQTSLFSLDQFFSVLHNYLGVLGSDKNMSSNSNYGSSARYLASFGTVNLSPLDLEILCSILHLLENIVKNDRNCCVSIAENQRYSCIPTLVGLLMGPVPRKLKAAILSCIAGFANTTASVALTIWIKMDIILPKSQIATSTFANTGRQLSWQSGIALEVEDIEPRNEEYPITIAFLSATHSLIKHVRYNRQPVHQFTMFDCTEFIINSILLKCNHRFYKVPEENWTIKRNSLYILCDILEIFDPMKDVPGLKAAFSVMWQILQENTLFTCIMEMIEDIVYMFGPESGGGVEPDQNKNFDLYEQCILNGLKLLNLVALKEDDFIRNIHNLPGYPSAMLLTLASLFSNVNHRTGNIDRLATLIKVISLPSIPVQIESLRLLQNLVQSDHQISERMLLQIHPFSEHHEDYFIHGFVDCLDDDGEDELCIECLKFILACAKRDALPGVYGFSHRILGFDRNKSNLRLPGTLGQTFNSFHAIKGLLDEEDGNPKKRALCMEIIYTLCNDAEVSENVLRFLRTSYELIDNLLDNLQQQRTAKPGKWLNRRNVSEFAWFMRILAIELKTTAENNLKSNRDSYIKKILGEQGDKKLVDLVTDMIFKHQHPEMSQWEFFDSNELWKTFSECSSPPDNVVDIKILHQKLLSEVNMVGLQLGVVQTNMIQNEIQMILQYAMALNASQEQLNYNNLYFEGWRELVETVISVKCLEIYPQPVKPRILMEILQELLSRVISSETVATLITPISSVMLLSSAALTTIKTEAAMNNQIGGVARGIMNLLESTTSTSLWNQHKRARVNFYATLLHLYRLLPSAFLYDLKIGSRLLKKLCKDILAGHEVTKVLAMSILSESELTWARDLSNDGTLKLLVDSLINDDKEILGHKFDVHCKAFYAFDSKMALLMKICTDATGVRIVTHAGVIETLSTLESFEMFPFLINQSDICYKMFVSVLRLMMILCTTNDRQSFENFSQFLNARSSVLCDIIRLAPTIKNSFERTTILTLITGLLAKLIHFVNKPLQRSFMCLLNSYLGVIDPSEIKIVTNILIGYVKLCSHNELTTILSPTWNYRISFANVDPPTLGSLVLIIDENVEKCPSSKELVPMIEACLYLVWQHLNLFFNTLEVSPEQRVEVNKLKAESAGIATDLFFSKIQNSIKDNNFVDVMIRRIKRVINLK
ncbi:nuclear pore complex protein Nup205 [Tetranychus urticae]|uniref:nuclear pore complex protein Nup205 n=1 Tax=Tetranychus urticae TaxID=32264 RepID=UPI00077B8EBF|nr:nuclear pore complex protein Nup205 [Tetranychus urticae]